MLKYVFPFLFFTACADNPPTTPETRPVENPNAGNTAIYDVDPDDPYEIGDGSFLDMRPGSDTAAFSKFLTEGTAELGGEQRPVYFIKGRREQRLGYLTATDGKIGEIHITSPDVVTEDGLRVGNTHQDVIERIGKVEVEQADGAVYLLQDRMAYRMDTAVTPPKPDAKVSEIIIRR